MNRPQRFIATAFLLMACAEPTPAAPPVQLDFALPQFPTYALALPATGAADAEVIERLPYTCERVEVHIRADGRRWHKRVGGSWTKADRDRFRGLIRMVAREMGADPSLLLLWAMRESTYNPYAIHVLNPDREAAERTWAAHRWDPAIAAELRAQVEVASPQTPEFWSTRAALARVERFKDNRYYHADIEFEVFGSDGAIGLDSASAWSYGYGPFGFNPTYYLPKWDATAPPWVFCHDDGLAAIVTAIWAARDQQRECESQGFDGSHEVVNRRFSSGHCRPRQSDGLFLDRAAKRGLDPHRRARLGNRWPAESTDRAELLGHLRALAVEEGLLSQSEGPG